MIVLGIETSCDDTSIAILNGHDVICMNTHSQLIHRKYGGVMPEMASREHIRFIDDLVKMTIEDSGFAITDIEAIAVTYTPGLAGSLLVGLNYAKGLSMRLNIPLIGVHHMEGHIASNYIGTNSWTPPFLCLLASGGHTMLVSVNDYFTFDVLGSTIDDAIGEAFDKTAKLLGLSYPGGPEIDKRSSIERSKSIDFPIPYIQNSNLNFSFSGLKTAVLNYVKKSSSVNINDVCSSFQFVAIEAILVKIKRALKQTGHTKLAIAGGVSANSFLRSSLQRFADDGVKINYPELKYCMDNGAMIGMAGYLRYKSGFQSNLDLEMKPVTPLDKILYESN